MATKKDKWAVFPEAAGMYDSYRFETMADAEEAARSRTVQYSVPYGIFVMTNVTEVPKIVTDITIKKVV